MLPQGGGEPLRELQAARRGGPQEKQGALLGNAERPARAVMFSALSTQCFQRWLILVRLVAENAHPLAPQHWPCRFTRLLQPLSMPSYWDKIWSPADCLANAQLPVSLGHYPLSFERSLAHSPASMTDSACILSMLVIPRFLTSLPGRPGHGGGPIS